MITIFISWNDFKGVCKTVKLKKKTYEFVHIKFELINVKNLSINLLPTHCLKQFEVWFIFDIEDDGYFDGLFVVLKLIHLNVVVNKQMSI